MKVRVFKQEIKPFPESFLRFADAAAISVSPSCNNNFSFRDMMRSHWVGAFLPVHTVNSGETERKEKRKETKKAFLFIAKL